MTTATDLKNVSNTHTEGFCNLAELISLGGFPLESALINAWLEDLGLSRWDELDRLDEAYIVLAQTAIVNAVLSKELDQLAVRRIIKTELAVLSAIVAARWQTC